MKRTAEAKLIHFLSGLPIRLHFRSDLHLMRKVFHLLMGLLIVFLYLGGVSRGTGVVILGSVLGFDLFMEATRLRNPAFNEKCLRFWGPVLRAHELNRFSTVPHYVSAAMISIGIFPKPVAVLSLLFLACGDPIASLVGILYGHHGPRFKNGKTLIGTLAGVLVCVLASLIYLSTLGIPTQSLVAISVLGGIVGGTVELLPFEVDDNFTIPVVSGFIVWFLFMMFGL